MLTSTQCRYGRAVSTSVEISSLRRKWFFQLHFQFSLQLTTTAGLSINTIKYPEYVLHLFQNLNNFPWSTVYLLPKFLWKSTRNFFSYLSNKQTDKRTREQYPAKSGWRNKTTGTCCLVFETSKIYTWHTIRPNKSLMPWVAWVLSRVGLLHSTYWLLHGVTSRFLYVLVKAVIGRRKLRSKPL